MATYHMRMPPSVRSRVAVVVLLGTVAGVAAFAAVVRCPASRGGDCGYVGRVVREIIAGCDPYRSEPFLYPLPTAIATVAREG